MIVKVVGLGVWRCLEHHHVEEGTGWQLGKGASLLRPLGLSEDVHWGAPGCNCNYWCLPYFHSPTFHKALSQGTAWAQLCYEELCSHSYLRLEEQRGGSLGSEGLTGDTSRGAAVPGRALPAQAVGAKRLEWKRWGPLPEQSWGAILERCSRTLWERPLRGHSLSCAGPWRLKSSSPVC